MACRGKPADEGLEKREAVVLPSFRLIVGTFLCSFLLAFFGLRLVTTTPLGHDALTLTAPLLTTTADWRRGDTTLPGFDLRFPAGTANSGPVPASFTLHALDRAKQGAGAPMPDPAPVIVEPAPLAVAPPPESTITDAIAPIVTLPVRVEDLPPLSAPPPVTAEEMPLSRVAALPEPTASPTDPPPSKDRSALLTVPLPRPPPPVTTAGISRPVAATPPRAKKKPARATRQAARQAAPPRPARAAARRPAAQPATAPPNPFSALFGTPSQ